MLRLRRVEGGVLVGKGTYGCVIAPSFDLVHINAKDGSFKVKRFDRVKKRVVVKMFKNPSIHERLHDIVRELEGESWITRIDPLGFFHVPAVGDRNGKGVVNALFSYAIPRDDFEECFRGTGLEDFWPASARDDRFVVPRSDVANELIVPSMFVESRVHSISLASMPRLSTFDHRNFWAAIIRHVLFGFAAMEGRVVHGDMHGFNVMLSGFFLSDRALPLVSPARARELMEGPDSAHSDSTKTFSTDERGGEDETNPLLAKVSTASTGSRSTSSSSPLSEVDRMALLETFENESSAYEVSASLIDFGTLSPVSHHASFPFSYDAKYTIDRWGIPERVLLWPASMFHRVEDPSLTLYDLDAEVCGQSLFNCFYQGKAKWFNGKRNHLILNVISDWQPVIGFDPKIITSMCERNWLRSMVSQLNTVYRSSDSLREDLLRKHDLTMFMADCLSRRVACDSPRATISKTTNGTYADGETNYRSIANATLIRHLESMDVEAAYFSLGKYKKKKMRDARALFSSDKEFTDAWVTLGGFEDVLIESIYFHEKMFNFMLLCNHPFLCARPTPRQLLFGIRRLVESCPSLFPRDVFRFEKLDYIELSLGTMPLELLTMRGVDNPTIGHCKEKSKESSLSGTKYISAHVLRPDVCEDLSNAQSFAETIIATILGEAPLPMSVDPATGAQSQLHFMNMDLDQLRFFAKTVPETSRSSRCASVPLPAETLTEVDFTGLFDRRELREVPLSDAPAFQKLADDVSRGAMQEIAKLVEKYESMETKSNYERLARSIVVERFS